MARETDSQTTHDTVGSPASILARCMTGRLRQFPKVHRLPVWRSVRPASPYQRAYQWEAFIMSAHPPVLEPFVLLDPAWRM